MMQKTVRGYLARKQHQPRIKGIIKINAIKTNLNKMHEIANQLKVERENMLNQVTDVQRTIETAVTKIRSNPKISPAQIDALYGEIMSKLDTQMKTIHVKLQEQRNAEEQERLRKIQAALEAERKAKEEDERRVREEEETRRKLVVIDNY